MALICQNCGHKEYLGAIFCSECGAKMADASGLLTQAIGSDPRKTIDDQARITEFSDIELEDNTIQTKQ